MLNRLSFIIAVSIVLSSQQIVGASPLTYDFTGTLNQPVDGSTTFTGSFTINANPTVNLVANPYVAEDGSDVSLSVNLGGHTINYVNTPQLSDSATFQLTWYSPSSVQSFFVETPGVTALPTLEFSVQGRGNITFGMGFDKPGGVEQLSNLRDISFPLNSSLFYVNVGDTEPYPQSAQWSAGSITSIEAVSVPEPNALVVSAMLGIAAMVYRRCHNS